MSGGVTSNCTSELSCNAHLRLKPVEAIKRNRALVGHIDQREARREAAVFKAAILQIESERPGFIVARRAESGAARPLLLEFRVVAIFAGDRHFSHQMSLRSFWGWRDDYQGRGYPETSNPSRQNRDH
jgi:hypothetical protein